MFTLKNLSIEAKRTGSIVNLFKKKTKKSELSFFLKTKGKKRKGSIVNYRSFAIPTWFYMMPGSVYFLVPFDDWVQSESYLFLSADRFCCCLVFFRCLVPSASWSVCWLVQSAIWSCRFLLHSAACFRLLPCFSAAWFCLLPGSFCWLVLWGCQVLSAFWFLSSRVFSAYWFQLASESFSCLILSALCVAEFCLLPQCLDGSVLLLASVALLYLLLSTVSFWVL